MALLGIIRRWHIRDQVPLREIARRLGISRNTVRRYLRSETVEPTYSERRSTRAIDKYAFQLSAVLKTEAARSRKQRRTLKQIHEDLKELGFEGSYDRSRRSREPGGRVKLRGSIRPANEHTLNVFLDSHGLLDVVYEQAVKDGRHLWVLQADRDIIEWPGQYMVIVDSLTEVRPVWSPAPKP